MRRAAALLLLLAVVAARPASAQNFDFHPPASADAPTAAPLMRDLAERVLPVYQEKDHFRFLSNLSALQMVAGSYTAADETRQQLRERRRSADPARPFGRPLGESELFDVYAHARAVEATQHTAFAHAFTDAFREGLGRLTDHEAFAVTTWKPPAADALDHALQEAFDQRRNQSSISISDAVNLVWTYFAFEAYRSFRALLPPLDDEDEALRYAVEPQQIVGPDGAALSIVVVRPKRVSPPLSTLLEFTLDPKLAADAKETAAHGYAGVVAFTRGVPDHPERVVPYQTEGEDARAVIAWIAKQRWSNGRVGMYGDGYAGFAAWAAARRTPKALKAIATADPTAPGVDFPMQGNIFRPAAYRWIASLNAPAGAPAFSAANTAAWRAVDEDWYRSGDPLRSLDAFHDDPSWIYHRMLNHPSYDLFWQLMIPFDGQFARVDIPVLTMSGYYADGAVGALYYYRQHQRYNAHADHTLLVGPYGEGALHDGPEAVVRGYRIDQAAMVDLRELRYQWFDQVLKEAPRPELLRDRVNYEITESDRWRHVPSLGAMGGSSMRLYLAASQNGTADLRPKPGADYVEQKVDFTDRSDAAWQPPAVMIGNAPQVPASVTFVGAPLEHPLEVSGIMGGELDLQPNKMDLDFSISLYELLPSGVYLPLYDPAFEMRASYARDRVHRRLLHPNERQKLAFTSERIMSRTLVEGSRLVVVLAINKRPDREINYGTGKDVREETIADGAVPLTVRWYGDTYIDLPIHVGRTPGGAPK